jgi:hypothetical protein
MRLCGLDTSRQTKPTTSWERHQGELASAMCRPKPLMPGLLVCHNQRGRAGSDGSSAMTKTCARYIAAAFGSFPCIAPHGQCNRVMCP